MLIGSRARPSRTPRLRRLTPPTHTPPEALPRRRRRRPALSPLTLAASYSLPLFIGSRARPSRQLRVRPPRGCGDFRSHASAPSLLATRLSFCRIYWSVFLSVIAHPTHFLTRSGRWKARSFRITIGQRRILRLLLDGRQRSRPPGHAPLVSAPALSRSSQPIRSLEPGCLLRPPPPHYRRGCRFPGRGDASEAGVWSRSAGGVALSGGGQSAPEEAGGCTSALGRGDRLGGSEPGLTGGRRGLAGAALRLALLGPESRTRDRFRQPRSSGLGSSDCWSIYRIGWAQAGSQEASPPAVQPGQPYVAGEGAAA